VQGYGSSVLNSASGGGGGAVQGYGSSALISAELAGGVWMLMLKFFTAAIARSWAANAAVNTIRSIMWVLPS
jgi:hypothetical protein